MSANIEFETPENVQIRFQPAGLGTRYVARFIDNILLMFLMFLTFIVAACAGVVTEGAMRDLEKSVREANEANQTGEIPETLLYVMGMMLLAWGVGSFLYFSLSELFLRGQTLGKRLTNIRVVRLDGFSLDPGSIFLRNIFRVIDNLAPLWIVPVISRRQQRLGDMAAGTVVVLDKTESIGSLRDLLLQKPAAEAKFSFDVAALKKVRPEDFEAVETILERWNELADVRKGWLLTQLVPPLATRVNSPVPPRDEQVTFLKDLLASEYRRQHRGLG